MCETVDDIITEGQYVIVKKQKFKKLYKVIANGILMLGKDKVQMHDIIGKRFWTTFAMIPIKEVDRMYCVKEVLQTESLNDLLNQLPSGNDNRTIMDDGTSQKLSKEEIFQLQESGTSGKEIVVRLIENNKSFLDKTEYSQEKYLKKKEQKYLKYMTIYKPTISLLHDVFFKIDCTKISNLRMDTVAQILSYSDVQSDGLYMLYDSGSHGLPAAAMLSRIGTNTEGKLITLHPGYVPPRTIVNAMNFPIEQLNRLIHVNIYSFLRLYYLGESAVWNKLSQKNQNTSVELKVHKHHHKDINKLSDIIKESSEIVNDSFCTISEPLAINNESIDAVKKSMDLIKGKSTVYEGHSIGSNLKRKLSEVEETENLEVPPLKKPRWLLQTHHAVGLIRNTKARGLVIIAKEHPENIVTALLPFLGASRPFIIYHLHREPLQETYMTLKQKYKVINLKLFSNFFRSYQVLLDRTHPDILTVGTGGYLLTGYLVE